MTFEFDGWPRKSIGHLFYTISSFVHHFIAIGELKLSRVTIQKRSIRVKIGDFLAATKQLYKWYFPSVCPSVCPSVHLSHLFDYVPIIVSSWNFQELLPMTKVRSMQKVKVRGQRSRSQPNFTVSGLKLQFEFTYDDEMMLIAWCCLEEVPYCFSRSFVWFQGHTALKTVEFDPNWVFLDCNSSLNTPMATKWCTKLEVA